MNIPFPSWGHRYASGRKAILLLRSLSILFNLQSVSNGVYNQIVEFFCGGPVSFLRHSEYFRDVIVFSVL